MTEDLGGIGFSSRNVGTTRIPGFEFTLNGSGSVGENWGFGILSGFTVTNPISVYPTLYLLQIILIMSITL